ncbi:hypothetical protein PIIN_07297 [Serendipita indica DSM 11827]|uniref:Uncharacterized protein n=1 Tax=Serendipita indica (strain DSM 11827) TaxID=1109443 RepID=G4TPU9_SERID|nr:hypothetical protein PIIN_07297 [Serendipita indica DSM 11827]
MPSRLCFVTSTPWLANDLSSASAVGTQIIDHAWPFTAGQCQPRFDLPRPFAAEFGIASSTALGGLLEDFLLISVSWTCSLTLWSLMMSIDIGCFLSAPDAETYVFRGTATKGYTNYFRIQREQSCALPLFQKLPTILMVRHTPGSPTIGAQSTLCIRQIVEEIVENLSNISNLCMFRV